MDIDYPNIPRYDYDKRHWKKIYGPEELSKLAELVTGVPASEITFSDSPSTANKATVRIRRKTKTSDSECYFPTG
jgi:hypothetical protein